MSSFLFDTNIVSALRTKQKISARVRSSLDAIPAERIFISVITLMEIEIGVQRLRRRDKPQAEVLEQWAERIRLEVFRNRVFSIDEPFALTCAALHVPDKRPQFDSLIAATAIVHRLTLVTRNAADFASIEGLRLLNPWD